MVSQDKTCETTGLSSSRDLAPGKIARTAATAMRQHPCQTLQTFRLRYHELRSEQAIRDPKERRDLNTRDYAL